MCHYKRGQQKLKNKQEKQSKKQKTEQAIDSCSGRSF